MNVARFGKATHPGRKRRRNEDSFVCEPPLFAIADGMGGAQAGELASRLAASALTEGANRTDGAGAEEHLMALIQEANRRVYERASDDEGATGMGTTVTAALVEGDCVTIGHVGDSRAYLLRDGQLEQLTEDHSLVAELVRSGKLSPEEAETHPQRSVITRALGPEPDVDVDVFSLEARPGDLFLLCSDGLSTMVSTEEIRSIVEDHRDDLDEAAALLVKAANRGGGEDNITVVTFALDEAGDASQAAATQVQPALADGAGVVEEEEEETLDELDRVSPVSEPEPQLTVIGRAPVLRPDAIERERRRQRPRRRRRALIVTGAVLALLVLGAVAGVWALSRSHFVGSNTDGHVVVYQGVPWDLFDGVRLYRAVYVSPVLTAELSQPERQRLFDHQLQSEKAARADVGRFEQQLGL